MGGLLDFEFGETYLGLTAGDQHDQPDRGHGQRPDAALGPGRHRGRPRQRARQLPRRRRPRTSSSGGDEAYDGSYWQARNPQNVLAPRRRQPHPRLPASAASSTSSSTASRSTTPSCRTRGTDRSPTAADAARAADDRSLPADRRAVGAPQRLQRRRRPARARVVRHLAQARAHRDGPDPTPLHYYDLGDRSVRRDHDLPVHGCRPRRGSTSAPATR